MSKITTQKPSSLYPIPGSKRAKKYSLLRPSSDHAAICEPFMGGAARSLLAHPLPCYLGEINPAQRAISLAPSRYPADFVEGYTVARERMVDGLDWTEALTYVGRKAAQKHLKRDLPDLYDEGRKRWHSIKADLFTIRDDEDGITAGATMFVMLAAFGNIIRLNPAGTNFNMSWHIDKLDQAMKFDPSQWVESFQSIEWAPNVYPCWQEALQAKPGAKTYLLLDPPYCVDGEIHKMTPCYRDHVAGHAQIDEPTLKLSTESLEMAIELGYEAIHLCNYWSERLVDDITQILAGTSYHVTWHMMGKCGALGNSAGRLEHGERVDGRERPIEWIWEIQRERRSALVASQLDFGLELGEVA
ncbi:MAG: hypothetical protein ACRC62_33880 [Microcoleus sp.]